MLIDSIESLFKSNDGEFLSIEKLNQVDEPSRINDPECVKLLAHSDRGVRKAITIQIPAKNADIDSILWNGKLNPPTLRIRPTANSSGSWQWLVWALEVPIKDPQSRPGVYCYAITDYIKRSCRAARIPVNPNVCANPFNADTWITKQMAEPYLLGDIIQQVTIPGTMKLKGFSTETLITRYLRREVQACMKRGVIKGHSLEDIIKLGNRSIDMELRYRGFDEGRYRSIGVSALNSMVGLIESFGGVGPYSNKLLRRTGSPIGRPSLVNDYISGLIWRNRCDGDSIRKISEKVGVSKSTVHRVLEAIQTQHDLKPTVDRDKFISMKSDPDTNYW